MAEGSNSRDEAAAARRQQLVEAATRCFLDRGVQNTPVSAIVREAGVAQGTFYLYFRSKLDIVDELRKQLFRGYERALASTLADGGPADALIVRVVRTMASCVADQIELEQVVRCAATADDSHRIALEGRMRMTEAAKMLFDKGRVEGQFGVDSAHLNSALLVTLFDNVFYESLRFGRPGPIDEVIASCAELALRSLRVPEDRVRVLVDALEPLPVASPASEDPAEA